VSRPAPELVFASWTRPGSPTNWRQAARSSRSPARSAATRARSHTASIHAAKHAAHGGIEREQLEALVDEGLSIRAIAGRLGMSYATVQHWLRRYELQTRRARRRAQTPRPSEVGPAQLEGVCDVHGPTTFGRRRDGYYRCLACRSEAVVKRRQTVKRVLVEEAGGACAVCGYDRSMAALQFHHVERGDKAFALSRHGVARSLEAARAEAAKCVLLCANCHAEVEAGVQASDRSLLWSASASIRGSSATVRGSSIGSSVRLLIGRLWVRVPPPEYRSTPAQRGRWAFQVSPRPSRSSYASTDHLAPRRTNGGHATGRPGSIECRGSSLDLQAPRESRRCSVR
jgi:transposase-like protein